MVKLRRIHRDPVFDLRLFCRGKKFNLPFPFLEKNLLLFGYARVALFEGLRILDIKEGDSVLVPNYICNVVMAAMHRLNVKVRFYEVDSNLTPLWYRLEQKIDKNTKALLVVNYFGFPNDLASARDLCDRHGIYLIEDNAHGFLSADDKKPLGITGNISIFSFRKVLLIPNGAALLVNDRSLESKLSQPKYLQRKNRDLHFIAKNLLITFQDYFNIDVLHGASEPDFEKCRIKDIPEEYNLAEYFAKFSQLNYFLLKYFNFDHVIAQRRNNYGQWLSFFSNNNLDNARIVFPILKNGIVPFNFPVLVEDQKQFILKMWNRGIECFPWPYLPKNSQEEYLSKRMVCLPVCSFIKLSEVV